MGRSFLSYRQRLRLDLFLVRRRSLGLYCKILWMTLAAVATGRDSI
jgi:lipopolysaccharide/colanic/teichoic acid biosynthesis glycosyltransferase